MSTPCHSRRKSSSLIAGTFVQLAKTASDGDDRRQTTPAYIILSKFKQTKPNKAAGLQRSRSQKGPRKTNLWGRLASNFHTVGSTMSIPPLRPPPPPPSSPFFAHPPHPREATTIDLSSPFVRGVLLPHSAVRHSLACLCSLFSLTLLLNGTDSSDIVPKKLGRGRE